MTSFRVFIEDQSFVESIVNEFNQPHIQPATKQKTWSAKKPEIMQMWQNLRPDTPIIITPISDRPEGFSQEKSTYGEDGIRITGSWQFISSVLSRLKEITYYENPQSKLRLLLRSVDKSRTGNMAKQTFVFYCNLENRSAGKAGRPKKLEI